MPENLTEDHFSNSKVNWAFRRLNSLEIKPTFEGIPKMEWSLQGRRTKNPAMLLKELKIYLIVLRK